MAGIATGRRQFLGGLLAAGLTVKPSWADAGSPAFLAAAARPDGSYRLCGIDRDLSVRFQIPLPARGHAAAAHPTRPEAVAFARRPGVFALVIDCSTGAQIAKITAPEGRHFYGHGCFSADGTLLFTTENDYEAGMGKIGVWDTAKGYQRVDEWDSGGVGPHELKRLPGTDILAIANGGIETHPDSGRTKLNIPTMRPNLAYLASGQVIEIAELPREQHKNSIRHLAVNGAGDVAFGMQWQGAQSVQPMLGIHRRGGPIVLAQAPQEHLRQLQGYIGSVAFGPGGRQVAVTSPRGGVAQIYDADLGQMTRATEIADVSGVAAYGDGFVVTSGTGLVRSLSGTSSAEIAHRDIQWDNHLVPV